MKKQRFTMSSDLKNIIPKLVSEFLLKPFLNQQKLVISDIEEWAIHQGGSEVIRQFCMNEILGIKTPVYSRSIEN